MGKKDEGYAEEPEALAPWEVKAGDIVETRLGVTATVLGVKSKQLWLLFNGGPQGGVESPIAASNASELREQGYKIKEDAAHMQRRADRESELRAAPKREEARHVEEGVAENLAWKLCDRGRLDSLLHPTGRGHGLPSLRAAVLDSFRRAKAHVG